MDDESEHLPLSEILEPGDEKQQSKNARRVKTGFWKTMRKAAADLPFAEDVTAAYYCTLDKDTPASVRGTFLAALAYFVLPLDLLPDFIIGFGFTDDIAVLAYVFSTLKHNIQPAHYDAARSALQKQLSENEDPVSQDHAD